MRVAMMPRALASASTRVRLLQFVPSFEQAGISVRVLPWQVRSRSDVARYAASAVALARWADVLVLQKPAQPTALVRTLARLNPRIVVDVDDAVWVSAGDGSSPSGAFAQRFSEAVSVARWVVAGSNHLADEIERFGPSAVSVIRPSVAEVGPPCPPARDRKEGMVIGWVGSGPNLADFEPAVLSALHEVISAGVARLVVVSDEVPTWPDLEFTHLRWTPDGEQTALRSFDVGLMPLRDDARSRGRCGYKAIQCLAVGAPVVVSDTGVGPEIVGVSDRGLAARGEREWVAAIRRLAEDRALHRDLSEAGRSWVGSEASVEASTLKWIDILDRVASTGRAGPTGSG